MRSQQSPAPTSFSQHNRWHSPMPYLFGGLAALVSLLTFALLLLACFYWRLSRYLVEEGDRNSNDHLGGDVKQADSVAMPPPCNCEGFAVIMLGDQKLTFLAMLEESKATAAVNELRGGDGNQKH